MDQRTRLSIGDPNLAIGKTHNMHPLQYGRQLLLSRNGEKTATSREIVPAQPVDAAPMIIRSSGPGLSRELLCALTKAAADADKQQVLDVDINRGTLAVRTIDADGFQNYEFRTFGEDRAELKVIVPVGGGGPYLHPFPMTKEPAKP